jgi:hypothetical protein
MSHHNKIYKYYLSYFFLLHTICKTIENNLCIFGILHQLKYPVDMKKILHIKFHPHLKINKNLDSRFYKFTNSSMKNNFIRDRNILYNYLELKSNLQNKFNIYSMFHIPNIYQHNYNSSKFLNMFYADKRTKNYYL